MILAQELSHLSVFPHTGEAQLPHVMMRYAINDHDVHLKACSLSLGSRESHGLPQQL